MFLCNSWCPPELRGPTPTKALWITNLASVTPLAKLTLPPRPWGKEWKRKRRRQRRGREEDREEDKAFPYENQASTGERQIQPKTKNIGRRIWAFSFMFLCNFWCPPELRGPTPTKALCITNLASVTPGTKFPPGTWGKIGCSLRQCSFPRRRIKLSLNKNQLSL